MMDPVPGDVAPTIYVDGEPLRGSPGPEMTGAQILAAAGHDADDRSLFAEGHHGQRIPAEASVPVQEGSRFITRPR